MRGLIQGGFRGDPRRSGAVVMAALVGDGTRPCSCTQPRLLSDACWLGAYYALPVQRPACTIPPRSLLYSSLGLAATVATYE